jgi:hypothetical protein
MEIFLYWFLWILAVAFNLLVICFIAVFFFKGHKEPLHYFQEYSEVDELAFFQKRLKEKGPGKKVHG